MTEVQLQEFILYPGSELRFQVAWGEQVVLKVKSGKDAEVLGKPLTMETPYVFYTGASVAVFTWQGCTVELSGCPSVSYVATETPMGAYYNAHLALETRRSAADEKSTRGPIALVVGPVDVGKSSLATILVNYSIRMGRSPMYVELDVGQGHIGIPGNIGTFLVEETVSIEEGISGQNVLAYHFGHHDPGGNLRLYFNIVSRLAKLLDEKMKCEDNKKALISGVIINTCGWIRDAGYNVLLHIVQAFEVDVILVLGNQRLYDMLKIDVPNVAIDQLPKSDGVVKRQKPQRAWCRRMRFEKYFYGANTHYLDVKFTDLTIYKYTRCVASRVPIGGNLPGAADSLTNPVLLEPSDDLLHHILGISLAAGPNDDVLRFSVAGFLCVTAVDMTRQLLTVLSVQPQLPPNTMLLFSELQYKDHH